jgi:hypothetical protein
MPIQDESWNQIARGNQEFSFQELERMNAIEADLTDDQWMHQNEEFWRDCFPFDDFESDELPW